MNRVAVESEFAPLKRVVVSQSELTRVTVDLTKSHLTANDIYLAGGRVLGDFGYIEVGAPCLEAFAAEREKLCELLAAYGAEVLRPRVLTAKERELGLAYGGITGGTGVTNFFVRDPFFTVGEHIIEGELRPVYRRYEVLPVRQILKQAAVESGCYYVGMPKIDISRGLDADDGMFLEGGDVLVYHHTVFVGSSGTTTNREGIEWLTLYLSHFGYEVVEVKLSENMRHLDCALSLVREGLLIACREALPDGLPAPLADWDVIDVGMDDARHLAINGLSVNEEVYITDPAFKRSVGAPLEERGVKVEYLDFSVSRSAGGSFRCSTQPLLRG